MSEVSVSTEQLLLRFGDTMSGISVRSFDVPSPIGTLVCFHGFVGNGLDFAPLAAFMTRNGYRVVCPDMFGRGESARFADPRQYSLRRIVHGAAAVLANCPPDSAVLGLGWGALIALLGFQLAKTRPRRFVSVELAPDFSVDKDPVIQRAILDRGLQFSSVDEAFRHLRTSPEFGALGADADLRHRIRREADRVVLAHDDAVTERTTQFGSRLYDLRSLYRAVGKDRVMLLSGNQTEPVGGCINISGLSPQGPLTLRTPAEYLSILGFLLAEL